MQDGLTLARYDHQLHLKYLEYIAANMRAVDRKEIGPIDARACLHTSVGMSDETHIAYNDKGEGVAMFGVTNTGSIWLLGTDDIPLYADRLINTTRDFMMRWFDTYDVLFNFVSIDNEVSIKWLKKFGAQFTEEVELMGVQFVQFSLTKEALCATQ